MRPEGEKKRKIMEPSFHRDARNKLIFRKNGNFSPCCSYYKAFPSVHVPFSGSLCWRRRRKIDEKSHKISSIIFNDVMNLDCFLCTFPSFPDDKRASKWTIPFDETTGGKLAMRWDPQLISENKPIKFLRFSNFIRFFQDFSQSKFVQEKIS